MKRPDTRQDIPGKRAIGDRQRARILELTAAEPLSAQQIANKLPLTLSGVLLHTKAMRQAAPRTLRIVKHLYNQAGKPTPLYGPGSEPDAEYTPTRMRKPKLGDRVEKRRQQVLELLRETPRTTEQIGILLHMTASRVNFYIRELRNSTPRRAYIQDWAPARGRGDIAPIYGLGNRPDKPKPRQTRAESYRRETSTPEKHEHMLAKRRLRYYLAKAKAKKHGPFSALGV